MPPLKLGFLGLQGRLGQAVLQELSQNTAFVLAKGLVRSEETYTGISLSPHQITTDISDVFERSDVVVDFTHAAATKSHLAAAVKNRKPFFLGTTGLDQTHLEAIKRAAVQIPLLQTSNTSVGAAILEKMVSQVAALLGPEYDIEIREAHHREKKDAPSGTALSLGIAAARGRGRGASQQQPHLNLSTHRQGPREFGEIGFSVVRGGDCVGEHEVLFMGSGEILRFSHQALGRSLFAKGALKGAEWLVQQPPGLYKMLDVLGM